MVLFFSHLLFLLRPFRIPSICLIVSPSPVYPKVVLDFIRLLKGLRLVTGFELPPYPLECQDDFSGALALWLSSKY